MPKWLKSTAICPKGVEAVTVYDRTVLVDKAINTVKKNLLEGADPGDRHPLPVSRQHPGGAHHRAGDPAGSMLFTFSAAWCR
jgi:hypothetical protein